MTTTSLSVVMPVFNEAPHLPATIDALVEAIAGSDFEAELVLVDDGSTDGSAEVASEALGERLPLTVVVQPNRGRFHAVSRGLAQTSGSYVLIVGSRVRLRPGALAFVHERMRAGEHVWTGHVHVHTGGNPYGVFQNVLTEIAWRAYFDRPRPVSFGLSDFDRFPKGSGCFVAPRDLLLEAFSDLPTRYSDVRHANDDTPMLRRIAAVTRINVAPGFASDYAPRGTLRKFLAHSMHRGTVFLDGHGRRESRFFPIAVGFYPTSAALVAASVARPRTVVTAAAATSVAAGALATFARRSRSEVATVALLAPVWAMAFGAGLWRGLGMMAAVRVRPHAAVPHDGDDGWR